VAAIVRLRAHPTELAYLRIDSTFQSYLFGDATTQMKVDATLVDIGLPSGSSTAGTHCKRINLYLPDIASTITVYGTATSSQDTGKEPVRIGTGANANKLYVRGSSRVGVATNTVGDTAQFSEIACLGSSSVVNIASGTTLTKFRQEAGTGNIYCAMTTLQQDAGTATPTAAGRSPPRTCSGNGEPEQQRHDYHAERLRRRHANLLDTAVARTITTVKLYKGATLSYDPNVVTITNPINVIGCNLEDVTIETPNGLTVAIVKT
jgi:hypothetical protein